jgi:hypothetical protein
MQNKIKKMFHASKFKMVAEFKMAAKHFHQWKISKKKILEKKYFAAFFD